MQNTKKNIEIITTRITVDLPKAFHKKLKSRAALLGKSMREIIIESVEEWLQKEKISQHELWVYDPENKHIVEHIKEGLKSKATIDRGSFAKYAKEYAKK